MKFADTFVNIYRKIPLGISSLFIVIIICYLTLDPEPFGDEELPLFYGSDKIAHFLMFGALGGVLSLELWRWSWKRHRRNNPLSSSDLSPSYPSLSVAKCILCFIISSVAGGVVELLQQQMQLGRSAELPDLVADSLGAFVGVIAAYLLARSVSRN